MREPTRDLRLTRNHRIRRTRDFQRLKETGERGAYGAVAINWTPRESGSPSRLGIITTRRLGPAVTRSRARRLIREAFRDLKNDLSEPLDLVVIARRSIVGAPASRVASDLQRVFKRQGLLARNQTNN